MQLMTIRMASKRLGDPRTLLLIGTAALFLVHAVSYRGYLLDDAYISLRYAANLAEGHGLVWNPGERVEGYSNFLWVLLGALFLRLGLDAMVALQAVSAVATLAVLALTQRTARLAGAGSAAPAVIWLLAAESFGYYATTGMETVFFTTLLTAAVCLGLEEARAGRRRGAIAIFVLLALTRPEGVFLFAVCQGLFALVELRRRGDWGRRRRAADGGIFVLCVGAWVAWRLAYYGEVLPNTYHAKLTGGPEQPLAGLLHLGDWARAYPLFALALVAPAALLARRAGRRRLLSAPRPGDAELLAIWLLGLVWTGYVVAVGGDSLPFHRFLQPVLPLLAVLVSAQLAALAGLWPWLRRGRRALGLAAVLLAVQIGAGRFCEEPLRAFVAHRTTLVGLETGRHLAATRDRDDLLAVNTAGALPWASRLPGLDMLGLTEPVIARRQIYVISPRWSGHRRGWGEHVLSRRPAVIVWYNSAGARDPHYLGDHQLADHPAFRFFYQLRRAELPAAGDDGRVVARFRGTPFGDGDGDGGPLAAPDLGVRFEIRPPPGARTVVRGAPIVFHYFERRQDLEPLWPLYQAAEGDLDRFLDAAIEYWRQRQADGAGDGDPLAVREVERLCAAALDHLRGGRTDLAKELLSRAAKINGAARSPLVGQYVANLAFRDKNLFLATQAQLEALRLAPDSALYRRNLRRLLSVPWKELKRAG